LPASEDYAIIDVTEGSTSNGKILVLLDDEMIAREIALELHRRGRDVLVQPVADRREPVVIRTEEGDTTPHLVVAT
jgi:hypothetical protein